MQINYETLKSKRSIAILCLLAYTLTLFISFSGDKHEVENSWTQSNLNQGRSYTTYCEIVARNPPVPKDKLFYIDSPTSMWNNLLVFSGWRRVGPNPFLPAWRTRKGERERVCGKNNPDQIKFSPPEASILILTRGDRENEHKAKPGIDYACPDYQLHNRIKGVENFTQLDRLISNMRSYHQKLEESGKGRCAAHFRIPASYMMKSKTDCEDLLAAVRRDIDQSTSTRNVHWISKDVKEHYSEGLSLYEDGSLQEIIKRYERRCGSTGKKLVFQRYIDQPLLYRDKYKFVQTTFLLVTSSEPLVAFYHPGYIKYSKEKYSGRKDPLEDNHRRHFPNLGEEQKTENSRAHNITYAQANLFKSDQLPHPHYYTDNLMPQIENSLINMLMMGKENMLPGKGYFEIFAVDYIVDSDRNVWLMKATRDPNFSSVMWKLKTKILNELAHILESRLNGNIGAEELPYKNWQPLIDATKSDDPFFQRLDDECSRGFAQRLRQ